MSKKSKLEQLEFESRISALLEQLEEDIKELQYILRVKTEDDFREQGEDKFEYEKELDNLWEARDKLINKLNGGA